LDVRRDEDLRFMSGTMPCPSAAFKDFVAAAQGGPFPSPLEGVGPHAVPMTDVVVLELSDVSRDREENLLLPFEGLDAGLLINGEDHLSPWRGHRIQMHDVPHLLVEKRILAEEPDPDAMWLQISTVQDRPDGGRADLLDSPCRPQGLGQSTQGPMCSLKAELHGFTAGHRDHLVPLLHADARGAPRSEALLETGESVNGKAMSPETDRLASDGETAADFRVAKVKGSQENDLTAYHGPMFSGALSNLALQLASKGSCEADAILGWGADNTIHLPFMAPLPENANCLETLEGLY
jgi:hypothetical protein